MAKRGRPIIDLTGQRFGRWTVLRAAGKSKTNGNVLWLCRCDCGNESLVRGGPLLAGKTKSCGCLNPHAPKPVWYKGEWLPRKEAAQRAGVPVETLNKRLMKSVDPEYVFQPLKEQDRAPVLQIEYNGKTLTSYGWSKKTGLCPSVILNRYKQGLRGKMLFVPTPERIYIEYDGKQLTVAELSEATGINKMTLYHRLASGDTGERLFRPVEKHRSSIGCRKK